ncbi:MAG: ATP-binding protein [bacterium]
MSMDFTVYIDLPDAKGAARLAKIVRDLGGDVHLGAADEVTPELVIATPGRIEKLGKQNVWEKDRPAILVWADEKTSVIRSILKLQVKDLIDPSDDNSEIKEIIQTTVHDFRKNRSRIDDFHGMEERYREISTIVRLSLEIGVELNVDKVLEMIVQQIYQDLGYEIVSIMLLEEDGRHLTIKAARGLGEKIISSAKVEVGKGVSGLVAKTGEPLLIKDIERDERFQKLKSHGRYSSKSLICVPLKVSDRVIGVLNGNNKKAREELSTHDLRLLSVFATQASVSIERARLYRSLEIKADEVKGAYDRLQELDRIKSNFITNVSHEFRTPVTVLLGYLEILTGDLTDPDQLEKVEVALDSAHRLATFVEDSTDILKLEAGTMHFDFDKVAIDIFLEGITQKYWNEFNSRDIEFIVDIIEGLPQVYVDTNTVTKVFDKLLDNSLKFTPAGGYTKITCSDSESGWVKIVIEDSGSGIPIGEQERVFERFEQSGDILTSKPAGTGLGLPIAKAIVARHGGELSIDEDFREGCRIGFTLPSREPSSIDNEGGY